MRHPEAVIRRFFGWYGGLVGRQPWPFLLLPLVAVGAASSGLFLPSEVFRDAEDLYTPASAPYKREDCLIRSKWSPEKDKFFPGKDYHRRKPVLLLVEARDGGSVLRPDLAQALLNLTRWATRDLRSPSNVSFTDVCMHWDGSCYVADHVRYVAKIFALGEAERQRVTYPVFRSPHIRRHSLRMDGMLGGAQTDERGLLTEAKAWQLLYELRYQTDTRCEGLDSAQPIAEGSSAAANDSDTSEVVQMSEEWEDALERELLDGDASGLLLVTTLNSRTLARELSKNGASVVPKFILSFALIIVFTFLCCFRLQRLGRRVVGVDWVESKPYLGLLAVLTALMGIASAKGLCAHLGIKDADLTAVMPFLALAIGVDNCFLFLSCWRGTSRGLGVEERMAETLSHAAVSISLTSVTDGLSFGVGALTPILGVHLFCVHTALAIFLTFAAQLTFLVAALALLGRLEESRRHCLFFFSLAQRSESLWKVMLGLRSPSPLLKPSPEAVTGKERFLRRYTAFLSRWETRAATALVLAAYIGVSAVGVAHIPIGFRFSNLIRDDSPSRRFYDAQESLFPRSRNQVEVLVTNVPDLSNANVRAEVQKMVDELSASPFGIANGTHYWMEGFRSFLVQLNPMFASAELPSGHGFWGQLEFFLEGDSYWTYDVILGPNKRSVEAFRLTLEFRRLDSNAELIEAAAWYRAKAAEWDEWGVWTYSEQWPLADQYGMLVPTLAQNLAIALGSMVVAAAVLLPTLSSAAVVAGCLLSIQLGLLGSLSWWGVRLDCVAMISVLMSIGFSVDFAAHIAYAFGRTSPLESRRARVGEALGLVAVPSAQGALSTVLGVSALASSHSYIAHSFLKTIVVIMSAGLFHALFLIPLLLLLPSPKLASLFPKAPPSAKRAIAHSPTLSSAAIVPALLKPPKPF